VVAVTGDGGLLYLEVVSGGPELAVASKQPSGLQVRASFGLDGTYADQPWSTRCERAH
jgi:hypothetical protein